MTVELSAVWSGTSLGASSARAMGTNAIATKPIAKLNFIKSHVFFCTDESVEKSFAFAIAFLAMNFESLRTIFSVPASVCGWQTVA
jgi:hypothetical protein